MSHFTRVRTQVRDKAMLVEALKALGYRTNENARVPGWGGQSTQADIAVEMPNGRGVGFIRGSGSDSYEIVADWMVAGVDETRFRQQVEQEYAAQVAVMSARAAGWMNLTRSVQPDGTILIAGTRF